MAKQDFNFSISGTGGGGTTSSNSTPLKGSDLTLPSNFSDPQQDFKIGGETTTPLAPAGDRNPSFFQNLTSAIEPPFRQQQSSFNKSKGQISPTVVTSDSARDTVQDQKNMLDQSQEQRKQAEIDAITRRWERSQAKKEEERQRKEDEQTERALGTQGDTDTGTTSGQDEVTNSYIATLEQQQLQAEQQAQDALDRIAQIRAQAVDPETNYLLQRVQNEYEGKLKQQTQQNEQLLAATRVSTIRSGIARLAPARQISIISTEESAGLSRIEELESAKLDAEFAAIKAFETGEFKIFSQQMDVFNNLAKTQRETAKSMYTAVQKSKEQARLDAKATRDQIEFQIEQQDRIIDDLSTTALSALEDIPVNEQGQLLEDLASQFGVDPNLLMNSINEKSVDKRMDELGILKKELDITRTQQIINNDVDTGSGELDSIINLYQDTIISALNDGQSADDVLLEITQLADIQGFKIDVADQSRLKSIIADMQEQTAIGSEDLEEEADLIGDIEFNADEFNPEFSEFLN